MSRAAAVLGTVATAIGIAGIVVGSVALVKVEAMSSVPSTVTVTAGPESRTASEADVHAAAVETCAAAETFRAAVGAVRQPYIDVVKASIDPNSPEFVSAEGRYFGGATAELAYLTAHINRSAPQSITDAITVLHKSATELLDADVRSEPGSVSNQALERLRAASSAVTAACKEADAGK